MDRKIYGKVPCYGCEDRHLGCHSDCERFLKYRKDLDTKNEINAKARRKDILVANRGKKFKKMI